ncbi:hypothetical protein ACSBR2_031605 [Camellia fascicularis]
MDPEIDFRTYLSSLPDTSDTSHDDDNEAFRGFDVANIPGVNEFHQILPMDINQDTKNYEWYSQLAVDEYNRRIKDANRELEFVKVLKAMAQGANAIRFYMTFNLKDLAGGGNIKRYQAVVLMGVGCEMSMLSFRLKAPEDEQGKADAFSFLQFPPLNAEMTNN